MGEEHDTERTRRLQENWYGFLWAVIGFGGGTGLAAPLILASEPRDRVIGGMIYSGVPLALVGLA
jgi:hypothetical protein